MGRKRSASKFCMCVIMVCVPIGWVVFGWWGLPKNTSSCPHPPWTQKTTGTIWARKPKIWGNQNLPSPTENPAKRVRRWENQLSTGTLQATEAERAGGQTKSRPLREPFGSVHLELTNVSRSLATLQSRSHLQRRRSKYDKTFGGQRRHGNTKTMNQSNYRATLISDETSTDSLSCLVVGGSEAHEVHSRLSPPILSAVFATRHFVYQHHRQRSLSFTFLSTLMPTVIKDVSIPALTSPATAVG